MVQVGVGIVGNARKKNDHWFAQCIGGIYDDVERSIVDAPLSPLDPVPDASAAGIRRLGPAPRDSWILREFGEIAHHTRGYEPVRPATTSPAHSTFIVLRAGWRERAKMKFSWRERKPVASIFSLKEKGRCHLLVSACMQDLVCHARGVDGGLHVVGPQNVGAFENERSLRRKRSIQAIFWLSFLSVFGQRSPNE